MPLIWIKRFLQMHMLSDSNKSVEETPEKVFSNQTTVTDIKTLLPAKKLREPFEMRANICNDSPSRPIYGIFAITDSFIRVHYFKHRAEELDTSFNESIRQTIKINENICKTLLSSDDNTKKINLSMYKDSTISAYQNKTGLSKKNQQLIEYLPKKNFKLNKNNETVDLNKVNWLLVTVDVPLYPGNETDLNFSVGKLGITHCNEGVNSVGNNKRYFGDGNIIKLKLQDRGVKLKEKLNLSPEYLLSHNCKDYKNSKFDHVNLRTLKNCDQLNKKFYILENINCNENKTIVANVIRDKFNFSSFKVMKYESAPAKNTSADLKTNRVKFINASNETNSAKSLKSDWCVDLNHNNESDSKKWSTNVANNPKQLGRELNKSKPKCSSNSTIRHRTLNLDNILSPVAMYIKNSPRVPQKRLIQAKPLSKKLVISPKPNQNKNKENQMPRLPSRSYVTSATGSESKNNDFILKLPKYVRKYAIQTPDVIKHKGSLHKKENGAMNIEKPFLDDDPDLTVCFSDIPANFSN